ncbi:YjbF family lipoprotein [Gemmobacter sp. 24YEA27]|uniref:YjbF family lipoprotein n=1 Tax=Gemmobacter sp. 24YEA27 TaxID=3040672 RepID=UPI0024B38E7A|nr:YjbF family lipoprotein [Gemmobacter sp. 24YEA27]
MTAMTPLKMPLALMLAALVLSGCAGRTSEALMARYAGSPPGEAVSAAPAGAARLIVRIPKAGQSALLHEAGARDGVRRWQASDNVQIYTRDGMIIGTRGLGTDLMSADTGAAAALIREARSAQVPRIYRLLDGEDRLEIRSYICDILPAQAEQVRIGEAEWTTALRVNETCHSPRGALSGTHWVKEGRILQSIQTFDPGFGPVDILFLP